MAEKQLIGRVPPEAVRMMQLPRAPGGVIDAFKALVDLTGTISDALDELGIVGAVSASELYPINPGQRIVGPALTVRNVHHATQIHRAAQDKKSGQGEAEAHNLAKPGDVLVIEGVTGCSNMGGQSATMGRRQGEAGAIVDGYIRDPDQYHEMGWPVWVRGVTPITGKWRMQTVEINGIVQIAGILVAPGDIVCADNAGICFVPRVRAAEVLEAARGIDAGDTKRKQDIDAGVSVTDLVRTRYK